MALIQQQIEVDADPDFVSSIWNRFVRWAHTGPGRLVCGELACVDAVRSGLVDFMPGPDGKTRVVFRVEWRQGGPPPEELERELGHDLVVFKDYVERSGLVERKPSVTDKVASEIESERRGDKPRHTRLSGESDSTFWHSHFPT